MATTGPLLKLASAEKDLTIDAAAAATKRLNAAQDALAAAMTKIADLTKRVADDETEKRAIDAALLGATTEAAQVELVHRGTGAAAKRRSDEARLLIWNEDAERLRREITVRQSAAAEAKATADRAKAAFDVETAQEKPDPKDQTNRAALRRGLESEATKKVADRVTEVLHSTTYQDALARVGEGLPTGLLAKLGRRSTLRHESVDLLSASVVTATHQVASLGPRADGGSSISAGKRAAYDAVERQARDYVSLSRDRISSAIAVLHEIAGSRKLSKTEVDAIVATAAAAAGALDLAHDLAAADAKEERTASVVSDKELAALAKNPDADPGSDPAVKTAKTAHEAARTAQRTARDAYKEPDREAVDALEAEIPLERWQQIAGFERVGQVLHPLREVKVDDLKTALASAEKALAKSLEDEHKAVRSLARAQAELGVRRARAEAAALTEQARTFNALRGDG